MLEWEAYDKLEPIGPHRTDWQAASMCAAIMNAMAIQVHSKTRFRVRDFLLEFGDEEKEASTEVAGPAPTPWQHMKFIAQMHASQANSDDRKKKRRR